MQLSRVTEHGRYVAGMQDEIDALTARRRFGGARHIAGELVEVTGAVRRTDRFRAEVADDGGDLVIEPCRYHLLTID